jgi:hypothetical protein
MLHTATCKLVVNHDFASDSRARPLLPTWAVLNNNHMVNDN